MEMTNLRKAAEMALDALHNIDQSNNYDKQVKESIRRLEMALSEFSNLEWFPAPTKTEWGESMICAAVNIDDNNYFDVYCEKWQKENVELLLGIKKREWVGLTDEDLKPLCSEWRIMYGGYVDDFAKAIEAKLKEKNSG